MCKQNQISILKLAAIVIFANLVLQLLASLK